MAVLAAKRASFSGVSALGLRDIRYTLPRNEMTKRRQWTDGECSNERDNTVWMSKAMLRAPPKRDKSIVMW